MSHETRTSPPTYPEVLDIHDGAFSESIWGSDGFRTIKVSGQSDVVADSYKDDLTIAAGTNVTITTNASGDTVTIASAAYTAGNGLQLSGNEFSVTALAITSVHEAANQTAHLALTTQEGDVVVRSDENKSYVRNAGTAGNMSDFTLLRTPTDLVLSVAGNTGAITNNQIRDAVEAATDSNTFTDDDHSKLNAIEASATADQTSTEIKSLLASDNITGAHIADDAIDSEHYTDSSIDHAHLSDDIVDTDILHTSNTGSDGQFLLRRTSNAGGMTWETITQTQNSYTNAEKTKLSNIETAADVTDATNVDAAGAVMNSDLDGKGELLVGDGSGDPSALAVGTNDHVLTADSSTGTGLKWAAIPDNNQNAFSNVAVSGQTTVAADSTTDTLTLAAGSNVTLTTNATSDTVTIAASNTNAAYMEKAGGTFTGDVTINDGEEIRVGSDSDLIIVHDGSNGTIKETTGNLDIRAKNTNGGLVTISDSAGTNLIKATAGSKVELTYNGTTKLETVSYGVVSKGSVEIQSGSMTTADSSNSGTTNSAIFGTGSDLKIYHNGTNTFITNTEGYMLIDAQGASNDLVLRAGNDVLLQPKNGEDGIKVIGDGAVELYHNDTKRFETRSDGVGISDDADALFIGANDDLKLYHNGGNALVRSQTGTLYLMSNSHIDLRSNVSGTEKQAIFCNLNGSVDLYHNNSKKFETTSAGVTVTGGIIAGGLTYPTSDGSNGQVLTTNGSGTLSFTTVSSGGLGNIVEDTSPQLGGDLDTNSFEISLDDDHAVKFGNDNDLKLHHTSGQNYIEAGNTGNLTIKAGNNIYLQTDAGNQTAISIIEDGAVELAHNGTKKFETTGAGATVTGTLTATLANNSIANAQVADDAIGIAELSATGTASSSTYLRGDNTWATVSSGGLSNIVEDTSPQLGGDLDANGHDIILDDDKILEFGNLSQGDLRIWHDSNGHSFILNNTGDFYIRGNGSQKIRIQAKALQDSVVSTGDGNVELYYSGTKRLETIDGGASVTGHFGVGTTSPNKSSVNAAISVNGSSNSIVELCTGDARKGNIYTDGTDLYITNNSTGWVGIFVNNNETALKAIKDGAVELYHNDVKKVETTADGIKLKTSGMIENAQYVRNDTVIYFQKNDGSVKYAQMTEHTSVDLYYDNSKKFETTSGGVEVTGTCTATSFSGSGANLTNIPASLPSSDSTMSAKLTVNAAHDQVTINSTGAWGVLRMQTSGTNRGFLSAGSNGDFLVGNNSAGPAQIRVKQNAFQWTDDDSTWYDVLHKGRSGLVLQTVQQVRTDTFSEEIGEDEYTADCMSLAITPTFSSSKILVMVKLNVSVGQDDQRVAGWLYKGGSQVTGALGDAASNRRRSTTAALVRQDHGVESMAFDYLDSPSTTSATTYSIRLSHGNSSNKTLYLNRAYHDTDHVSYFRSTSSLTLMEITA